MSAPFTHRATFTAMSVTIAITGVGISPREHERAMAHARVQAEAWEERFSRFRPQSMLSRLNAASGGTCPVDETFLDVLTLAATAVTRTEGRFDPSILPALEAAGYDRSIERVLADPHAAGLTAPVAGAAGWRSVAIDREHLTVTLPPEMRIDLGGIAKGAFVDMLAAAFGDWPGGCVDAGGDLRVWGVPPSGTCWTTGIEDPARPGAVVAVIAQIDERWHGVATSAMNRRRWRAGDDERHHLIDPGTGRPLRTAIASVTAFAPTVAAAEVTTKAVLVASSRGEPLDPVDSAWAASVDVSGQMTIIQRSVDAPTRVAATDCS
ncbi:MAG TPA: FAD:protein FMN transferase [Thermomicrobiales bacterium]|nr:FAD:protein FMN transferase [Thermomicrobiales bacterium]